MAEYATKEDLMKIRQETKEEMTKLEKNTREEIMKLEKKLQEAEARNNEREKRLKERAWWVGIVVALLTTLIMLLTKI